MNYRNYPQSIYLPDDYYININDPILYDSRLIDKGKDKPSAIESYVNEIYKSLEIENQNFNSDLRKDALNSLITNVTVAYVNHQVVGISRRKNDYACSSKFYGIKHNSYDYIIPSLDALIDKDFIDFTPGWFDIELNEGKRTRIWASTKLIHELDFIHRKTIEVVSNYFDKVYPNQIDLGNIHVFQKQVFAKPVILKDKEKNIIPYIVTKKISSMLDFLHDYNDLIVASSIQIPVREIPFISRIITNDTEKKNEHSLLKADFITKSFIISYSGNNYRYGNYVLSNQRHTNKRDAPLLIPSLCNVLYLNKLAVSLYRVFNNGSWGQGGRFYGAQYQQLSEDQRSKIRINSNEIIEVDFSALHPTMLYNLEGKQLNEDPYLMIDNNPEIRPLLKLALNTSINAETPKQTIWAFNKRLKDDPEVYELMHRYNLKSNKLIEKCKEKHPFISKHLNSGIGIKLQYQDSQIAQDIMKHFIYQGIPILCIHDSFIVDKKYQHELTEVMKETYKKHMRFNINVK
jgi:hypothetical protein